MSDDKKGVALSDAQEAFADWRSTHREFSIEGVWLAACDWMRSRAVEKDAARYQFMRNSKTDLALVIDKVVGEMPYDEGTRTGGYPIYEYRAGEELDSAIDAAMHASAEASKR